MSFRNITHGPAIRCHLGTSPRGPVLKCHLGTSPHGPALKWHLGTSPRGPALKCNLGTSPRGPALKCNLGTSPRGPALKCHLGTSPQGPVLKCHLGTSPRGTADRHVIWGAHRERLALDEGSELEAGGGVDVHQLSRDAASVALFTHHRRHRQLKVGAGPRVHVQRLSLLRSAKMH